MHSRDISAAPNHCAPIYGFPATVSSGAAAVMPSRAATAAPSLRAIPGATRTARTACPGTFSGFPVFIKVTRFRRW